MKQSSIFYAVRGAAAAALLVSAVLFISCSDNSGTNDDNAANNDVGNYSIKVASGIQNGVVSANRTRANVGEVVTITTTPAHRENIDDHPYHVATITAAWGGGNKKIVKTKANTYTFTMPEGDVVVSATFSDDPETDNADLAGISVSNTEMAPLFDASVLSYAAKLPFDIGSASIAAFAVEEAGATVELTEGDDPVDLFTELEFEIGIERTFTITVSAENGITVKIYTLKIVRLPDLSLSDFYLENSGINFRQDLAKIDTQDISVPNAVITTAAVPTDSSATVSFAPAALMSGLNASKTIQTVSVKKTINGVEFKKDYIVRLSYAAGMPQANMATGGNITYVNQGGTAWYEIHRFLYEGALTGANNSYNLAFVPSAQKPQNASILIAAGGGGGGWSFHASCPGGGGGAGGLIYDEDFNLSGAGTYSIIVGNGGAGCQALEENSRHGYNGNHSYFGTGTPGSSPTSWSTSTDSGVTWTQVSNGLLARGGGGGGNHINGNYGNTGNPGGSGGGAGASPGGAGLASQGSNGGAGQAFRGSGGGGAGGAGNAQNAGIGKTISIVGISGDYAGGGAGGDRTTSGTSSHGGGAMKVAGVNGTGGGGGGGLGGGGYRGGSGIVVVWFKWVDPTL